ncbi:hypothetical protein LOK49_LG04G02774 [Camellia lanceoleosa]|uniref:Uncharacterized protein n=1 Tax=Camellia lanceoleosa TaxID=1840588 RepID=A0ACC0I1M7_9ERIC|nr:hypothetical protein LOK49_LG04G02774 [Camellia lanceoleosa]
MMGWALGLPGLNLFAAYVHRMAHCREEKVHRIRMNLLGLRINHYSSTAVSKRCRLAFGLSTKYEGGVERRPSEGVIFFY